MISSSVEVYGVRETLAEIRQADKALFFEIRAYMKRTGDSLGTRVIGNIPMTAPISGMRGNGRTAWKPATFKTIVSGRNARKGTDGATPLLSVKFLGAAVNIADMAGRGGGKTRKAQTDNYSWRGTTRSHAVTSQGQAMIRALGRAPSRYIWPEAESALPLIQSNVLYGVEAYMDSVNRNLTVIKG